MARDDGIDRLMSDRLPRPLRELVDRAAHQHGWPDADADVAAEWVREVGDRLAKIALCQLILILACPPEVVWSFDVGCEFEEPFGWASFYGHWQTVLAVAVGVPAPPAPDRSEWHARWRAHRELLASIPIERPNPE